jgi:hypothetical protein
MSQKNDDLAEAILICVSDRHEEARAAPRPPDWRRWEVERHEEDLRFGPRYSTVQWFGSLAASNAQRVACLRTVYRLGDAGLLEIIKKGWGDKVDRVRLTDAGRAVVAKLRKDDTPAPERASRSSRTRADRQGRSAQKA